MVTQLTRMGNYPDPWLNTVLNLENVSSCRERAIATITLLGVDIVASGQSLGWSAQDNPDLYGVWRLQSQAAVAYCVAEGLDIET